MLLGLANILGCKDAFRACLSDELAQYVRARADEDNKLLLRIACSENHDFLV